MHYLLAFFQRCCATLFQFVVFLNCVFVVCLSLLCAQVQFHPLPTIFRGQELWHWNQLHVFGGRTIWNCWTLILLFGWELWTFFFLFAISMFVFIFSMCFLDVFFLELLGGQSMRKFWNSEHPPSGNPWNSLVIMGFLVLKPLKNGWFTPFARV